MSKEKTHLVCQHLEKIHRNVLERHQDILKDLVRTRHGIYSLYKGTRLYYVGLASNLRGRLKHHLKDRHEKTWDHFSIYLTIESSHLRELEALSIRIASPEGNRQKGKLKKSQDMRRLLKKAITLSQKEYLCELMGGESRESVNRENLRKQKKDKGIKFAKSLSKGLKLRFSYRDKIYRAFLKKNRTIRYKNKIYTSPSSAASKITHHGIDGWFAWKYERAPGDWVYIDELRR